MRASDGTTNLEGVVKAEIIEVEEEFCAKSAQAFKDRIRAAVEKGRRYFVVDFQKTKLADSACLESLLWSIEEVQEKGGLLKVACLNETLKKVFQVTQFDQIFEVYEDVLSAVKACG